MDKILAAVPLYVLLPVLLVLAILLALLIWRALSEGREINLWLLKIGARPRTSDSAEGKLSKPTQNDSLEPPVNKSTESSPHIAPKLVAPRLVARSVKPLIPHLAPKPNQSRVSYVDEIVKRLIPVSGFDPATIRTLATISKTRHSTVKRCIVQGDDNYVLKSTKLALSQPETLKRLVGKQLVGVGTAFSATIATPLSVWTDVDYVYELHPYYAGISLLELILRNKYSIRGRFLGGIYNSLLKAVHEMHKEGILHRDIAPSNILITPSGNLVLIDCSFACAEGSPQIPVGTSAFTPPEQLQGQASISSDWFSLAATIFFLASGYSPDKGDWALFKDGLMKINTGNYGVSPIFKKRTDFRSTGLMSDWTWFVILLFESLLEAEVLDRPSALEEVMLFSSSAPAGLDVIGILDTGEFGYIVTQEYDFCLTQKEGASAILSEALLYGIDDPGLQQDAKAIVERDDWSVLKPT